MPLERCLTACEGLRPDTPYCSDDAEPRSQTPWSDGEDILYVYHKHVAPPPMRRIVHDPVPGRRALWMRVGDIDTHVSEHYTPFVLTARIVLPEYAASKEAA